MESRIPLQFQRNFDALLPGIDTSLIEYFDPPGTFTKTAIGTYDFEVPYFSEYLDVEIWSAGGIGGRASCNYPSGSVTAGSAASPSSFHTITAGGGLYRLGGTATGGDVNTSGTTSTSVTGGAAANGGPGKGSNGSSCTAPGQGTGTNPISRMAYGGGGGSYVKKRFTTATISRGVIYQLILGTGAGGVKCVISWR